MKIEAVIFDVDGPITSGLKFWSTLAEYAGTIKIRKGLIRKYLNHEISYNL